MGIVRIYQGKSKPAKKKPGWQQQAAEYQAWLDRVNSMTLGAGRTPPRGKIEAKDLVVPATPVVAEDRQCRPPSLKSFGGIGGKPVVRPDVLYKDDPDMLERELKARQRKFNVAPAYNKGGDVFVTEEELMKQLAGNKRRP